MKKIIAVALLTSVSLMAAQSGQARYVEKCAMCHGSQGQKTPIQKMKPIAGMDAQKVASILVNYQNDITEDDLRVSHGYNEVMVGSTLYLSRKDIDNIAKYVSSLKK